MSAKNLLNIAKSVSASLERKGIRPSFDKPFIRHGDVLLYPITKEEGGDFKNVEGAILAYGEVTGHKHQVKEAERVRLMERLNDGSLFMDTDPHESSTLVHEEHHAQTLAANTRYMREIQDEWRNEEWDRVID